MFTAVYTRRGMASPLNGEGNEKEKSGVEETKKGGKETVLNRKRTVDFSA